MAYLEVRNGRYRVAFRYEGKLFKHNLGAVAAKEAEGCLARVEDGLRLLARGRLEVPPGADLALFLVTDGKLTTRRVEPLPPPPVVTLGQLRDAYLVAQGRAVEENTLLTIRIHFKHLVASLGEGFDLAGLKLGHLDRYVAHRLARPGRKGRPLNPDTVREEVRTLSSAWSFGVARGLVSGTLPAVGLVYPKTTERPPFRTRVEIEATLARGADDPRAWESLFLTLADVGEVLALIRDRATAAWLYPMACLAAHTGARRALTSRWFTSLCSS